MEIRKADGRRTGGTTAVAEQMQAIAKSLTTAEKDSVLRRSNLRGLGELCFSLGMIALAGLIVILWSHPITWICAWFVFGTRQLGLVVLMHEAAHGSLFRSRRLNEIIGSWVCAAPFLLDIDEYRTTHQQHHLYTGMRYDGSQGDPDLVLVRFYPLSRKGLSRWLWRDVTGRVMFRLNIRVILTRLGYMITGPRGPVPGTQARQPILKQLGDIWRNFYRTILVYAILCGALLATGQWPVVVLWFLSWYTLYPLLLRIRLIAEHGIVEKSPDLFKNTRTTLAAWWERFIFAPHHVHYHLEHHLMPAVPCYRLPYLHRLLSKKRLLEDAKFETGYAKILKLASSRDRQEVATAPAM